MNTVVFRRRWDGRRRGCPAFSIRSPHSELEPTKYRGRPQRLDWRYQESVQTLLFAFVAIPMQVSSDTQVQRADGQTRADTFDRTAADSLTRSTDPNSWRECPGREACSSPSYSRLQNPP